MELISLISNAKVKMTLFNGSFLSRHLKSAPSRNVIAPSTISKNQYSFYSTVMVEWACLHGVKFVLRVLYILLLGMQNLNFVLKIICVPLFSIISERVFWRIIWSFFRFCLIYSEADQCLLHPHTSAFAAVVC